MVSGYYGSQFALVLYGNRPGGRNDGVEPEGTQGPERRNDRKEPNL
jgi:hypothetical protein